MQSWLFCSSRLQKRTGAAILFFTLGCAPSQTVEQANLLTYVFPLARSGQIINHTFYIANDTDNEKRVQELKSSCGCTVANVTEGIVIPPKAKLAVPVEMNLAGKEGQVNSTIEVRLSGQNEPLQLTLTGTVHVDCPATVEFGTVKRGDGNKKSFKVRGYPGQPKLELVGLEFKEEWFDIEVNPTDGETFDMTVSLKPSIPYGVFDIPIKIHTNDGEVPVKKTNIRGRVLGRLEVSEKSIYFGALKQGKTLTKSVELSAPYGDPLMLISLDNSKQDIFQTHLAPLSQGNTLPVSITTTGVLPEGTPTGVVKATLFFHTRVGGSDESARVEVYGLVQ